MDRDARQDAQSGFEVSIVTSIRADLLTALDSQLQSHLVDVRTAVQSELQSQLRAHVFDVAGAVRTELKSQPQSHEGHRSRRQDAAEPRGRHSGRQSVAERCEPKASPTGGEQGEAGGAASAKPRGRQSMADGADGARSLGLASFGVAKMEEAKKRVFGSHVLGDMMMTDRARNNSHLEPSSPKSSTERFRQAMILVASSHAFDSFSVFMILVNSIIIGVETDHVSRYKTSTPFLKNIQIVFNVWYILEVCLKLFTERSRFFIGIDCRWNLFDTIMVIISIADLVIGHNLQIGRTVRIIRMIRIMRTMRILRSLRYLREFRKMVFALTASAPTLFWSLVLLLFVMYTFAVWFTQAVSNHQIDVRELGIDDGGLSDLLEDYYGDLLMSIYTLYKSITSGMSWGDASTPLCSIHWVYFAFFLCFISLTIFGVLNIITSVFVDSAMMATQNSREMMLEDKLRKKEVYVNHLKDLFKDIDADGSGILSEEELEHFVSDEENLSMYFEALEIDASDARRLFKLLDADESGEVDISEFCDGCMQLKGQASSFDINCMIYEQRRVTKWLSMFMSHVEDELRNLLSGNQNLEVQVKQMSTPGLESNPTPLSSPLSPKATLSQSALISLELPVSPNLGPSLASEGAPPWGKRQLRFSPRLSVSSVTAVNSLPSVATATPVDSCPGALSSDPGGDGLPSAPLDSRLTSDVWATPLVPVQQRWTPPSGEVSPFMPQTSKPKSAIPVAL